VDSAQLAHSLGVATGRRELAERLLAELRRTAATWRGAEAKTGGLLTSLRSAFFWAVTERWCSRVEALAAQVEAQLAELRTAEVGARVAYEMAAATPTVPAAKTPAKRSRR